jgi:predicted DNA-binding transcriptional regulator YafY
MLQATRPPLARLAIIDQVIRAGRRPNAATLARQLEVSPRTVQRDLLFLRDRLQAPLAFDARGNGYHYTCSDYQLPFFRLTEGELIALFLAEQVVRQCQGTPYGADLRRALARLAAVLPESISVDLGSLAETLSVAPTTVTVQDVATFAQVSAATNASRQLELDYWTASRNVQARRVVNPYHLALIDGSWFLVAWCHSRRCVRTFAVQRIRSARPTGESFDRPADFRIADYLRGSFRAMRGDGWHKIILRFTPATAGRVAEKIWHPTQKSEPCPDGSLLLRFEVSDLREVLRWVLSWGRECCVEGPVQLRQLVCEEVDAMHRSHGNRLGRS